MARQQHSRSQLRRRFRNSMPAQKPIFQMIPTSRSTFPIPCIYIDIAKGTAAPPRAREGSHPSIASAARVKPAVPKGEEQIK